MMKYILFSRRSLFVWLISLELTYILAVVYLVHSNIGRDDDRRRLQEVVKRSDQCEKTRTQTLSSSSNFFYACAKEIKLYENMFAVLNHVVIEPSGDCLYQNNDTCGFNMKFLSTHCRNRTDLRGMHLKDPILSWLKALKITNKISDKPHSSRGVGFIVARHDVNNLYHTMTQIYNIVVAKHLLQITYNDSVIIFVDVHNEKTMLQELWNSLFKDAIHTRKPMPRLYFDTLVMINSGYEGHLSHLRLPNLPFISEFTEFFTRKFEICRRRELNCLNINILIILRQDTRNENDTLLVTERKFHNERQMLSQLRKEFPKYNIRGVRLDSFPIRTQFSFISQTDFLIGMHGAGLTYTLFLPEHAGVLELFPSYRDTGNTHYRTISKWRNLFYRAWQNFNLKNEFPNFETRFSARTIGYYIMEYINAKCKTVQ
ncbi:EGF domain-specific O-linked N-acetylglucosamine transferase-like [Ostrea edulis]|uniref:EGF domain-specific O-linked N-acetylglucosamine transferase-like n=1 Tax=Ostrea edulis TaxID=37623 RepID=UPI0024AEF516|nr:EGF domain-specific O-linked N-acetylglucosamine transferase-like [Ostrea edulis]